MSEQPSFPIPDNAGANETTGRYIITFREDAVTEGLGILSDRAGVTGLANAADFPESALDSNQLATSGGAVFPTLGVAVVSLEQVAASNIMTSAAEDSAILAIEPERIFYAINDGLSADYLRGYRDAVNHLYEKATDTEAAESQAKECFADDLGSTWGLKATKVMNSQLTGKDIKVAVLDTGLDLLHPDFAGRSIVSQSFVPGEEIQDGNSHGTHCIGTACGFKDLNGRRYGVAWESTIYAGKVLSNEGSGEGGWILAGMEWAIASGCQVISMSLGNTVPTPSTAYETIGRRALQNRCLIVAAAGNHGPRTVGQPANSPSIMAVAAVDNCLQVPNFSSPSGTSPGAKVDIAAPGVKVYSSIPVNQGRYAAYNGTSMATPHVAGLAALYAQWTGKRGSQLWQLLASHALPLPLPSNRVGSGLLQAP
ncbi:MAG: S8 family serine peptidase [Oscillatoriaceae cyanobacterium Prado104]|jgi:subtilisin family serine protease|nr:S8 family serine peptidase [Oscillatoriaceae cyanobacterium Prado104]